MTEKIVVFVIGMHRSGSSRLSAALRFAGFRHGPSLMEAAPDDPKGFWESRPVANMNELILNAMGASWDNIPAWIANSGYTEANAVEWAEATFSHELDRLWKAEFGSIEGPIVINDPRLSFTLPLWEACARRHGYSVRHVLIVRDPLEVATSLHRRNGMTFSRAVSLWVRYNASALSLMPDQAPVLRFQSFVSEPLQALRACGFNVPDQHLSDLSGFMAVQERGRHEDVSPRPAYQIPLVRSVFSLIGDAVVRGERKAQTGEARRILARIRTADELNGNVFRLGPPSRSKVAAIAGQRTVILHCHLFKNAGTSVDHVLKTQFGERLNEHEYPGGDFESNSDLVLSHIQANTAYTVFSTHTGNWYLDYDTPKLKVMPIIFVRHPLLRIVSAYQFERQQVAETAGSVLAKSTDLSGYITTRLSSTHDYALQNFQARRLACFSGRYVTDVEGMALEALDRLPFIGLVENFSQSMMRLEQYLKPDFPAFQAFETQKNVTSGPTEDIENRLENLRADIGTALYDEMIEANRLDLLVFDAVSKRYQASNLT